MSEAILRHIETFSYLKNEFEIGRISREEYWGGVKLFLLEIALFSQKQEKYSLEMETKQGEVFLNIKISESSEGKVSMILIPDDIRSVPFTAVAHGFYEPFQADILVELGKRSDTFIDIGANMGFYSLSLCKENPSLHSYSFEPNPNVFNILNSNIKLNKFDGRISTYNIGLSDTNEKLTLFEPTFSGSGAASLRELHVEEGPHIEFLVEVKKLDEFKLQKIDLIKIDVEGNEYSVLMGSLETILSSKPTICAELLRKWMKPFNYQPQDFVAGLLKLGYLCFSISNQKLYSIEEINDNTLETNFIFCHKSKIEHLDYLRGLIV